MRNVHSLCSKVVSGLRTKLAGQGQHLLARYLFSEYEVWRHIPILSLGLPIETQDQVYTGKLRLGNGIAGFQNVVLQTLSDQSSCIWQPGLSCGQTVVGG
jgi:hypothetical protein